MVSYKLIYFDGRGLGEISRYIFAVAGQEYEDYRIEYDEWIKLKQDTLFGQLPILVINDDGKETKLAQSLTIARYLARKFNLAGSDELTQAKAEMVLDHFADLVAPFRAAVMEHDDTLQSELFKKFSNLLPNHFECIEKILENQKTQYLAGDQLTIADLSLAVNVDRFESYMNENELDRFPLVKKLTQKVNSIPQLAEYKSKRPITNY